MERCLKNHKEIIYEYGDCPCCEYLIEIEDLKFRIDDFECERIDLNDQLKEA